MLRDGTIDFDKSASKFLQKNYGIVGELDSLWVLKYEEITPDVFLWLIMYGGDAYIIAVSDRASDVITSKTWLSKWLNDMDPKKIESVRNTTGEFDYSKDGFDYVWIFKIDEPSYDHEEYVNVRD